MAFASLSSLASWNALERAADRWASAGAFALACASVLLYVLF